MLYYDENAHLPSRRSTFHSAGVLLPGHSYEAKFTFFQWYTAVHATHRYFPPLDYFTRILSVFPLFIGDFRAIVHEPSGDLARSTTFWHEKHYQPFLQEERNMRLGRNSTREWGRTRDSTLCVGGQRSELGRTIRKSPKYISDGTRLILK